MTYGDARFHRGLNGIVTYLLNVSELSRSEKDETFCTFPRKTLGLSSQCVVVQFPPLLSEGSIEVTTAVYAFDNPLLNLALQCVRFVSRAFVFVPTALTLTPIGVAIKGAHLGLSKIGIPLSR